MVPNNYQVNGLELVSVMPILATGGLSGSHVLISLAEIVALSGGVETVLPAQAAAFTAVAGYRYRLNSTGGNFNVALPVSPTDGVYVSFVMSAGTNTVTFTGGSILGGVSTIGILGGNLDLQYNATTGFWEQI